MANIPCSNPTLCGVQSHRPGTYAPCHKPSLRADGREIPTHPMKFGSTPKPATTDSDVADYRYTPTNNRSYGDGNYVPVTDLGIELAREHGVIITPDGPYAFSFEGYDENELDDNGNPAELTVAISSKRDRVWITFDGESEGEYSEFHDKYEASEWMNEIFAQYGKQIAVPAEPEEKVEYGPFDPEKNLEINELPETLDEEFTFTFNHKGTEGEFYVTVTGLDEDGKAQYEIEMDPDGQYDDDYREVIGELVPLSDEDDNYSEPESKDAFDAYFQTLIQENYADEVEQARSKK